MYKISLLCVILCAPAPGQTVDKTLEPKAHGRDVVEAVVDRIQKSNVFTDDKDYLRRVAYVESRFGDHSSTYRSGYYGGIWQVDSFKATQQDWAGGETSPALQRIHAAIKRNMGIDWMQLIPFKILALTDDAFPPTIRQIKEGFLKTLRVDVPQRSDRVHLNVLHRFKSLTCVRIRPGD